MNYSYNIFNPLDYLRLLFLAFFNWPDFPTPTERDRQFVLAVQGLVVIVGCNGIVVWLTAGGGEWNLFFASVAFGVAGGVTDVVAFGVTFGVAKIWGFSAGIGIALVVGFLAFWITFFLMAFILTAVDAVFKPRSALADWMGGMVLLILWSLGVGCTFAYLARWLPDLRGLGPLLIGALFFVFVTRLPLWPLETAIGLLGCRVGLRSQEDPWGLLRAIEYWYFDRHALLPLPWEAFALRRLAALDWNVGILGAIKTAENSGHLLQAVKALRTFAGRDPYGVQAHIAGVSRAETRRLLQFTFHKQPEPVARARAAYETLVHLGQQLRPEQKDRWSDSPLLAAWGKILDRLPDEEGHLNFEGAVAELSQAIELMQLSRQAAGEHGLSHADEMIALYGGLEAALHWSDAREIAAFRAPDLSSAGGPHLFPEPILQILADMGEFARTMAALCKATSRVTRQQILLQSNEQMFLLGGRLRALPQPAGPIVSLVIFHWERLLASAGSALARGDAIGPLTNPYVVGNPVTGDLFVGREDILHHLEELWTGAGQKPSVVIYGHRRMGKSSILHNLGAELGPRTILVDFNMQRVGMVASTNELLYNLALALYDSLPRKSEESLEEPDESTFVTHNPYTAFDRFLKRLDHVRGEKRFIVTVDEFERIEELIAKDRLERGLMDYWRGIIETYPWLLMAFAGLHTIEEMTHEYWHPFFGNVTVPVSFLSPGAARRLITQPTPDFAIDYDQDALEHIVAMTHGQPYLVQLVCHGLLTRFNRQTFEEGIEPKRRFSLADVEAIIETPEFFRDGNAYFTGVWVQAEQCEPAWQTVVLRALAWSPGGADIEEIARTIGLGLEDVQRALDTLKRHDAVTKQDGKWRFAVELMRRWVLEKKENRE